MRDTTILQKTSVEYCRGRGHQRYSPAWQQPRWRALGLSQHQWRSGSMLALSYRSDNVSETVAPMVT